MGIKDGLGGWRWISKLTIFRMGQVVPSDTLVQEKITKFAEIL